MANELIRGENCIIIVSGKPVFCARTCSLNKTVEIIPKSTIGSGTFKEFKGVSKQWSLSADGVLKINDSTNNTYQELDIIMDAMAPVAVGFTLTDMGGNTFNQYGSAIIVELGASGSVNNVGACTITLQGTGLMYQLLPPEISISMAIVDEGDEDIVHVTTEFVEIPEATSYDLEFGTGDDTVLGAAFGFVSSPYTFDGDAADFVAGNWIRMRANYPAGSSPYGDKYILF